jgi:hypothetical protein
MKFISSFKSGKFKIYVFTVTIFHSEIIGTYQNLLNDVIYYGIFHSEMIGTYQILPNDVIRAFFTRK